MRADEDGTLAGLAGYPRRDHYRARRLFPGTLHATEPGVTELGQMLLHAFDKTVTVQEAAAWPDEVVDCPITGEDLFRAPQIVERDGGNREVEGPSDLLRP
jgi:hypothetical protein